MECLLLQNLSCSQPEILSRQPLAVRSSACSLRAVLASEQMTTSEATARLCYCHSCAVHSYRGFLCQHFTQEKVTLKEKLGFFVFIFFFFLHFFCCKNSLQNNPMFWGGGTDTRHKLSCVLQFQYTRHHVSCPEYSRHVAAPLHNGLTAASDKLAAPIDIWGRMKERGL